MLEPELTSTALEPVRSILQADGADIELVGVTDDTATLRLLIADANCAECVLPREMLELVALDLMTPIVPGLRAVSIEDPRTD